MKVTWLEYEYAQPCIVHAMVSARNQAIAICISLELVMCMITSKMKSRSRVNSFACGANLNYDKRMLGHKQKLLGHVPGVPGLGYASVKWLALYIYF